MIVSIKINDDFEINLYMVTHTAETDCNATLQQLFNTQLHEEVMKKSFSGRAA